MTSRERVMAAFRHEPSDFVPRWAGMSEEFHQKACATLGVDDEGLSLRLGDDFRRVFVGYDGPNPELFASNGPFGLARAGIGYGIATTHPLADITEISQLEEFPWPDPQHRDPSNLRRDADRWAGEFAILGGEWSPFWHDVIDLVGHEQLYYQMFDRPDLTGALFEKVTDYYVDVTRVSFEESGNAVDIFFIGNDLGGQTGPLLGPDLYDEFLRPSIRRLIDLGHEYGKKVMMHCCGGYRPLIPMLIEDGMDGLHALQPDSGGMDPAGLKADFGGDILLNGGIDSHHILIDGESPEFVRRETLKVLEIYAEGGGYVAGASHDSILPETPLENVLAMMDAVAEFSGTG